MISEGNDFIWYFHVVSRGFWDPHVIVVILTVFLASRGETEEKLFAKQTIHFRDLAKGEYENVLKKNHGEVLFLMQIEAR